MDSFACNAGYSSNKTNEIKGNTLIVAGQVHYKPRWDCPSCLETRVSKHCRCERDSENWGAGAMEVQQDQVLPQHHNMLFPYGVHDPACILPTCQPFSLSQTHTHAH